MQIHENDPLALFLSEFGNVPLDQLANLITALVAQGAGHIITPAPGLHSPATVDWEIECLGVYAKGLDRLNAARNWLKVARSIAGREAA